MSDDKPPIQWSATLIPTTRTLKSALKVTKEDLHNNDPIFPFSTRPSEVVEQITEIKTSEFWLCSTPKDGRWKHELFI